MGTNKNVNRISSGLFFQNRNNTSQLNKLIPGAKVFSLKMEVDPAVDFLRRHKKRSNPKKVDFNFNSRVDFGWIISSKSIRIY